MSKDKSQRKSAVGLFKQQLQESKQMQDFLELEKSQLKRVAQQMENEWQHDRARLDKDRRKLEKAQQFYAKLCNSKLALKKKLAEKEKVRNEMRRELQQLNYQVMSLSNELQIEKDRVAEMEAAAAPGSLGEADSEMQLLKQVGEQLEQASDEVLLAKERIKRSSQELRYLMCQLSETCVRTPGPSDDDASRLGENVPVTSSDEEDAIVNKMRQRVGYFQAHVRSPIPTNKQDISESMWTLCQRILGSQDLLLQSHQSHMSNQMAKEAESGTQTEPFFGGRKSPVTRKSAAPPYRDSKQNKRNTAVPKAVNTEPYRALTYVSQNDQTTQGDMQSIYEDTSPSEPQPIISDSQASLKELKGPTIPELELSPVIQTATTDSHRGFTSQTLQVQELVTEKQPSSTMLVAMCDTSLQCSSEPLSEQGASTLTPSGSDVPNTCRSQISPTPRTSLFVPFTSDERTSRNKVPPVECVSRTPPLRQPIQLTICQQFYQPLRPICPPANFARNSSSVPTETLFFRDPMPPLTLVESPEFADACIGTSPFQTPRNDVRILIDERTDFAANQLPVSFAPKTPLLFQAELACSSDSSGSHNKTPPNDLSPDSPIKGEDWAFVSSKYHTQLDIDSSSSKSDLDSVEIVEIGSTKTASQSLQLSGKFSPQEQMRGLSPLSYNSDVDAM